ncbi:NAD(P)/FAD-dependent oxidoreductase [Fructilactobacillus sp. Tb1]|uniref:NAD(P)/FAD-dependent oxidoreductase n=1 Tax=Fructilactobacillus sp. Tb1 TaxID=3422304 RepID=UPI003D2D8823
MMVQKIAIIGGGIVGSTAAYYLSKDNYKNYDVTLFDEGIGQATKAAAGIISPWLSKRRNKQWYHLASEGAALVAKIAHDTNMDEQTYANDGTIITRDDQASLDELLKIALKRKEQAPEMGDVRFVSKDEIKELIPIIKNSPFDGLFVPGGSRIDGQLYCQHLQRMAEQRNLNCLNGHVTLINDHKLKFNGKSFDFDKIIIATGAWSKAILSDLNINLNLRPQKGQLIEVKVPDDIEHENMPVMMPESEYDFIPLGHGKLIIGATHDNDQGFNLDSEKSVEQLLVKTADNLISNISTNDILLSRVGTRAYTYDFGPFFGVIPNHESLLIGTGLGSSGLTTGPLVGKFLVDLIKGNYVDLDYYQKPINTYIN